MNYRLLIIICTFFSINICAQEYSTPTTRNPLKWPFSSTSIWNMPIGSNAVYVNAYIEQSSVRGMTIDEDIIVLRPESPLMNIYYSDAAWDKTKDRCTATGGLMLSLPVPQDFIVSKLTWIENTPNACSAVLMPDKRTIKQHQPFAHCTEGGSGTTGYLFTDQDLYGDGYYGAHGGSKLSAIGGTLRVGELTPTSGPIRHVLKINLNATNNLYYDESTKGYRWPALRADAAAPTVYYQTRKNPIVPACRMGALLALPAWMNLDSLEFETEPAKILAKAFQDYGAYVVDNAAINVYGIETEWGPDGRFRDEFLKNWGFSINPSLKSNPWSRDMDRIFMNLYVVDNNSSTSIGGGGTPRAPLAPTEFVIPTSVNDIYRSSLSIYPNIADDVITIVGIDNHETVRIYNNLGIMVKTLNVTENNQTINISSLASGMYFFCTSNGVERFIKK